MNKAELVDAMAKKSGETKKATEENLNAFIEVVTETLKKSSPLMSACSTDLKTEQRLRLKVLWISASSPILRTVSRYLGMEN